MRSAIVTGCSKGIGRGVTEMLLAEGWEVLGISRTMPDAFATEHRFSFLAWDLGQDPADYEQPKYLTGPGPYHPSDVLNGYGTVDALIHCAGIRGPFGPFLDNDPEAWGKTIETNLLGTLRILRASLPLLQRSEDGRILLFSGGGAFAPEPGFSAYACTKAATIALMETIAVELAGSSVTVNAVAPGFVATGIHQGTPHDGKSDGGEALGRAVACVRHLLSPATRGLNGRTVSAVYDDWSHLTPMTVPLVVNSHAGTRTRFKIQMLESASRHPQAVLPCPVGATA